MDLTKSKVFGFNMNRDQAKLLADGLLVWGFAEAYKEITGEKMNLPKIQSGIVI